MVRGKRGRREVVKSRGYRFRSEPQTTPLASSASISLFEYPNSASTSWVCWLNFGGGRRRLGLLRGRRIGRASPLYQSFSITPARGTGRAFVGAPRLLRTRAAR